MGLIATPALSNTFKTRIQNRRHEGGETERIFIFCHQPHQGVICSKFWLSQISGPEICVRFSYTCLLLGVEDFKVVSLIGS